MKAFVLFAFLAIAFVVVGGEDPCSVSVDGKSFDLSGANTQSDLTAKDAGGNNYFFQVCQNTITNCSCSGCTQSPACQKDNNNNLHSLGQLSNQKAFLSAVNGNLQIQYLGGQKNRSVQYNLTCDTSATTSTVLGPVTEPPGQPIYYIRLASAAACSTGSSGGKGGLIFIILFFSLLAVYFIGGALFMKFARGASGKEIIPNVEFWQDLPSLIKEGFMFVINKIRGRGSYSSVP